MKNLFKMTTAALALVAFASCSNDELLGSKNSPEAKNFTSILEYEIEEPDGLVGTRAARNAEGKGFVFQEGDQLRVYDEDLGKFDTYTFATQFGREGDTKLQKDPAYALFPYGDIRKGYCNADGDHIAEIKIGERVIGPTGLYQVIEYSNEAGSEAKVGDEVLYKCNVPMWGTVEKIDDKTVKADKGLKPLTGVLMLTLGKTLGNAAWLKLSSATHLGGTFYANLDSDEPKLYVDDKDEYQDLQKDLYIDLRKVPSDKAVLYIPVVAGVNDLKIYRTTDTGDDPKAIGSWIMISNESGYTFKRNGYHKVSYEYPLAASAPEDISTTMEQLKAQTEDLELNMAFALDVTGTVKKAWDKSAAAYQKAIGANDNTIYMPKMAAETVTLNIKKDVTTAASPKDILKIVDADVANPFTGTLVVNAETVNALVNFDIDLPKATVVLEGNFAPTGKAWKISKITADVVEIGDGTIPTTIDVNALAPAGTNLSGVKTAININKGATFKGLIDTQAATTYFAPITIKGKVDGSINTNGDVNVELAAPNEAITGKLTFFRGGTTCTLKQGYIKEITNNFSALGEANNHEVTVKLDDAEGITAIKEVNVVPHGTIPTAITLTESTLSGKTIPGTINTYTSASTGIYTASQFEYLHTQDVTTPADVTILLGNDLNMAKAAWKAPFGNGTTAHDFSLTSVGNVNHTIKNLSYNKYEWNVEGVGLVGKVDNLTMSDITLDNVSFTAEYFDNRDTNKKFKVANIGGIAGTTTAAGAVDLDRVTVNLANNFGYSAYKIVNTSSSTGSIEVDPAKLGIGGFIGIAEGPVAFDQVNVKGALIQGYTCLGGFVGQAQDAITVDGAPTVTVASKSEIAAFKSNYSNPLADDMEMNFARIAAGFGYVQLFTQNIAIGTSDKQPTATPVAITVPAGKTGKTFVALGSLGSGQTQYMYSAGQPWIGFCGTEAAPDNTTSGTITISGKTYEVPQVSGTAFTPATAPNLNLYNWVKKN